jgi:hypothetical protein
VILGGGSLNLSDVLAGAEDAVLLGGECDEHTHLLSKPVCPLLCLVCTFDIGVCDVLRCIVL